MVSPFLFLAAISVALAQSRSMMPVQMQYEQPGLTSWSQFAKTVSPLGILSDM